MDVQVEIQHTKYFFKSCEKFNPYGPPKKNALYQKILFVICALVFMEILKNAQKEQMWSCCGRRIWTEKFSKIKKLLSVKHAVFVQEPNQFFFPSNLNSSVAVDFSWKNTSDDLSEQLLQ